MNMIGPPLRLRGAGGIFSIGILVLAILTAVPGSVSAQDLRLTQQSDAPKAPGKTTPLGKKRKPTLRDLYAMFFNYATHVEERSKAEFAAGRDRSLYRWHLQKASGLTQEEYSLVLRAAERFAATEAEVAKETVKPEGLTDDDKDAASIGSYVSAEQEAHAKVISVLETEITGLREDLGTERTDILDYYLLNKYQGQPIGSAGREMAGGNSAASHRNASPQDVTFQSGENCYYFTDNYGYASYDCVDSQMYYFASTQIEFASLGWANSTAGFSTVTTGNLTIDNQPISPAQTCSTGTLVAPSNDDDCYLTYTVTDAQAATYTWTTTQVVNLTGGGTVTYKDPNPPTVALNYPDINTISTTAFIEGASGTFTIDGENLISPFQNDPEVFDHWGFFTKLTVTGFSYADQTVDVSYTVGQNLPLELGEDEISVWNGYYQNGTSAWVNPPPVPPQITYNGSNVAGTTQAVYAGQQIALSVTPPAPMNGQAYTIASQTWSFCQSDGNGNCAGGGIGDITGGFTDSAGTGQPSASGGGMEASDPDVTQSSLMFYFLNPGTTELVQVTVTYSLLGGGQSAQETATATFTIAGPTGNLSIQPTMKTNGTGVQILASKGLSTTGISVTTPQGVQGMVGIDFKTSAVPPSGTNQNFTFVQILNGVQQKYINSLGPYSTPTTPTVGIDKTYPYAFVYPAETWDQPSAGLPTIYGEGWETFTATMYLMWDPGIPPSGQTSCTTAVTVQNADGSFTQTASTCASIPIPLSSVSWHWSGCAINTQVNQTNQTTWTLSTTNGCPVDTLGTVEEAGFPEWAPLSN